MTRRLVPLLLAALALGRSPARAASPTPSSAPSSRFT
jgi:hypothetical protein